MLGIDDPQIWLAYILCFVSAIGCIIYGALKWNDDSDDGEVA
ncbi:symporter small accessory protein [Methanolobus psychrotolerans]|nr:symporter small accessory protein [Methanolobus psychrotolerans]